MVNEIIIPKENKAQVEEVRELENEKEQKKLDEKKENKSEKFMEKLEEKVLPTVHASDDDEVKEGLKKCAEGAVVGSGVTAGTATLNPAVGAGATATTSGIFKGLGKIMEGVGKLSDDESIKKTGEAFDEGSGI